MNKETIVAAMKSTGMIPVFYHAEVATAKEVMKAAYLAGVRVFEFTNRAANAYEIFVQLVDFAKQFDGLHLGIGTIMDKATAQKYIDAGAHFIVAPIFKAELVAVCQENEILFIPGCATLTEIVTAKEAGASIIKIFPGSVLGPGFVSSVLPVVPDLQMMPTGGVEPTEQNLSAWFGAGVVCVGMGSQLLSKKLIDSKNWEELQQDMARTLDMISKIRAVTKK